MNSKDPTDSASPSGKTEIDEIKHVAPPEDCENLVFIDSPGLKSGFWAFPRAHLAAVHCRSGNRLEFLCPTKKVVVFYGKPDVLLKLILDGAISCLRARHPLPPGQPLAQAEIPTVLNEDSDKEAFSETDQLMTYTDRALWVDFIQVLPDADAGEQPAQSA